MTLDAGRQGAVIRKEFRVLLRSRFIIVTMTRSTRVRSGRASG